MDTETTLREIARGSRDAFTSLYREQRPMMIRYATGLLAGDLAAAEDAVDEAFVAIWQQAGRFGGNGSANGWIRRIVRNKAIDWLRKQRESSFASDETAELVNQVPDPATSPHECAEQMCDGNQLRRALATLSFEQREAVWLCYFEDKSLSEIAEIADCPQNTVKTRLFYARKSLQATLTPRCLEDA